MWSHKTPPTSQVDSAAVLTELRPALIAYFRRRCGNTAEAEDLAQDVILRALTHARWSSAEEAKRFVFHIALNRWRDRGRRKLTHSTEIDWNDDRDLAVTEEIPIDRVISGEEELRRTLDALQELSERTREVLVLCRFEYMKQAEIAELLGISVSAVEKHLVKALAHLAQRLNHDS